MKPVINLINGIAYFNIHKYSGDDKTHLTGLTIFEPESESNQGGHIPARQVSLSMTDSGNLFQGLLAIFAKNDPVALADILHQIVGPEKMLDIVGKDKAQSYFAEKETNEETN